MYDNLTIWALLSVKTMISLGIGPILLVFTCTKWVAKDLSFLCGDSDWSEVKAELSLRWAQSQQIVGLSHCSLLIVCCFNFYLFHLKFLSSNFFPVTVPPSGNGVLLNCDCLAYC